MMRSYHHLRMISTATPMQNAVRKITEAENSLIFAAPQNQFSAREQDNTLSTRIKSRALHDYWLQESSKDQHDCDATRKDESDAELFAAVFRGSRLGIKHVHNQIARVNARNLKNR